MTKDQNKLDGWRERFEEFLLEITDESKWIDGKPTFKGCVYVTLGNAFEYFIAQERQTLIEWVEENVIGEDEEMLTTPPIEQSNLIIDEWYSKKNKFEIRNKLRAKQREKLQQVKE